MGSGKNKGTQLAFPPLLQQNKGWRKSTHTKRGRSKVGNEPIPRGGGGGEARWWSVGLTFHNFPPGEKEGGTEGGRRGPTDLTDVRGKEKGMKGGKESFFLPLLLRRPDEGKELEGGREGKRPTTKLEEEEEGGQTSLSQKSGKSAFSPNHRRRKKVAIEIGGEIRHFLSSVLFGDSLAPRLIPHTLFPPPPYKRRLTNPPTTSPLPPPKKQGPLDPNAAPHPNRGDGGGVPVSL